MMIVSIASTGIARMFASFSSSITNEGPSLLPSVQCVRLANPPSTFELYTTLFEIFHCGYKHYLCMTQVLHKSPDRNHTHSEKHCCQRKFKVCAIGDLANGSLIQAPLTEIFGEKFALVLHYSRVP